MISERYEDDDEDFAGFGAASAEKPHYDRDDLKYARSRIDSQYKEELLRFIEKLPVTDRLKTEYYDCIYALFCPDQVLANNNPRAASMFFRSDPLKKQLIFAEQGIKLVAACNATKGDKLKITVGALERYMLMVYEAFITRTIGPDREGIRNAVITSESSSRSERRKEQDLTPQKKKGIFNIGG